MGPPISTIDKGYHREFLVKHDMSSRCVVTYIMTGAELHLNCQSDTSNTVHQPESSCQMET